MVLTKKEVNKRYYLKHKAQITARVKKYQLENSEKVMNGIKEWQIINKEKVNKNAKKWRERHPLQLKEVLKKADAKRRSTPKGKLRDNVKRRINKNLHGTKAHKSWEALVGYTADQLKKHLEKLFTPEMSWENYGTYWHVDHKTPIAVFNFEKPEDIDFRLCWSLKNLQPLEAKQNISKGVKMDNPFQPSLLINIGG